MMMKDKVGPFSPQSLESVADVPCVPTEHNAQAGLEAVVSGGRKGCWTDPSMEDICKSAMWEASSIPSIWGHTHSGAGLMEIEGADMQAMKEHIIRPVAGYICMMEKAGEDFVQ